MSNWQHVADVIDGSCIFEGQELFFRENPKCGKRNRPTVLVFADGEQIGALWTDKTRFGKKYLKGKINNVPVTLFKNQFGGWKLHVLRPQEQRYQPPPKTVTDSHVISKHFQILGISPPVTVSDVQTAFRKLALRHHPDKATGSHEKFIQLRHAYEAAMEELSA